MRILKMVTAKASWLAVVLAVSGLASYARGDEAVTKSSGVLPTVPGKARIAHITLTDVTSVAAKKGWLQEEFAKYNAKVDLILTTSYGGTGVEASLLDRGDLHITSRMAYPALQHRANGLDAVIIWQSINPHPRRAVTLVQTDSDIHTVADLKGKTFGSSIVGCPYYAGVESLRAQGVTVDNDLQRGDVRLLNITGAAATSAFLAGRFEGYGVHPTTTTTASLYIQNQAREVATAVPNGIYVTAGGRTVFFAMRKWAEENPDLVKAFLVAWDRTVRWLYNDPTGAHLQEAATIAARELRVSRAVALFSLKDEARTSWTWGITDYKDVVASIKKFQTYQISVKDPFFTKNHLNDKEIEAFVDRRFFAGGQYFVDVSEKRQGSAAAEPTETRPGKVQLAKVGSSH